MRSATRITIIALFIDSVCSVAWADSAAQAPTQVALSWPNIATLAFSTGLLTALLNQVVGFVADSWKERRATELNARPLALKLINELETFANACAYYLAKTHYESDEGGISARDVLARIPSLPPLNDLADAGAWAALDNGLSTSAATMNDERDQVLRRVQTAVALVGREHESEYVFETFYEEVDNIGLKAAHLACKLRKRYGKQAMAGDSIVNTICALKQEKASIAQRRTAGSIDLR